MGFFHEGHLSLIRRARRDCDVVVVSLFVNPTQFATQRGSRHLPARRASATPSWRVAEGVDLLFVPAVDEVYPDGFGNHGHRRRP